MKKGDVLWTLLDTEITTVSDEPNHNWSGCCYDVQENGIQKLLQIYASDLFPNAETKIFTQWIDGKPDDSFVWPETRLKNDPFAYIFPLRQNNYISISKLIAEVNHQKISIATITKACTKLINAFRRARRACLSCVNIEDEDVFIDPQTGDVLIYGFEKMFMPSDKLCLKNSSLAPEMMEQSQETDLSRRSTEYSENYILSRMLFRLCFWNHPLEGEKLYHIPCLTPQISAQLYGRQGVFVFDPKDDSNRPVKGIQRGLQQRWDSFPEYVQDAFCKAFSKESIENPESRIDFYDWEKVFDRLSNDIILCASCKHYVVYDYQTSICPLCGKQSGIEYIIVTNRLVTSLHRVPAARGKKLISFIDTSEFATVVSARNDPHKLGLKNLTSANWAATINGKNMRQFSKDAVVPIKDGVQITTGNGIVKIEKAIHGVETFNILTQSVNSVYPLVPVICVVEISNNLKTPREDLERIIKEALFPLYEKIENENACYKAGLSILFFSDSVQWTPDFGFYTSDSFDIRVPAYKEKANLGNALESLNRRMSKDDLFSETAAIAPVAPVLLFFCSGRSSDHYEEELKKLQRNKWYRASFRVAIRLEESVDPENLKKLTGDIESIINSGNYNIMKKAVIGPID